MAITPFKVIQITDFGTNRKLIYDFLLVTIHFIHSYSFIKVVEHTATT